MKQERFKRTKSVAAASAIALVVAALVMGLSSLVLSPRSASSQHPGFDLASNPSTFSISSTFYKTPSGPYPAASCSGTGALVPGGTLCVVFHVTNTLNVPISVTGITSALDSSSPTPPAMCMGSYLTLPTFSGSLLVPANGSANSSGVPITLKDSTTVNQDACKGFTYHFTYTGSAQYTDSTSTTLTSTPNPSTLGQSVTFKATVTAGNPSTDASPPSGTVSFYKCTSATVCPNTSTNLLGTGTIGAGGVATYSSTTSQLTQGLNYVEAVYPASGTNFTGSTSSVLTQDVQGTTTTSITSSPNPSALGTSVTFTATVAKSTGTGSPTGTVSFFSGTPTGTHTLLATNPLNSGTGKATYSTSSTAILPLGTDNVYAVYNGDTYFSSSTSPVLNQVVTTAACSNGTINGGETIKSGQLLCFTGTINGGITIQSGGGLYLGGARINGGITSTSATTLIVCGSTINGNISATGTTGYVLIGDGGDDGVPGCAGNTMTSNVTLTNNKGGFEFAGNSVTGTVTLTGNTGSGPTSEDASPEVEGNKITGSLSCATSNSPAITDGGQKNTVTGTKSGQCGERVLMARRKHRVVPTDQMVPADPITQELPLGGAEAIVVTSGSHAPTAEDEAKGYWDRARGRTPARPSVAAQPETIRTMSAYNEQGSTGEDAPAADEANSYWDRARGVAPRRPVSPALPVAFPRPAAAASVTPEPALPSLPVTQGTDAIPSPLVAAEAASVTTEGLAATESAGTVRGAHVRKEDAVVAPVLGAHAKADDPLADAAWHTRLAEDDALATPVRDPHVRAEDPLAGEVQAAQEMRAAAATESATETLAVEPSRAADAQDSAGQTPGKARRRRWGLVPFAGAAAALTAGLGGGGAFAYFTTHGTGTGTTTSASPQAITATELGNPVADTNLFPGGPGVAVHFTVNNPNHYAVSFAGWSGATLSTVTPAGSNTCTTGDFQIAAASGSFGTALSIPANTPSSPGVSGTANGVVQLKTTAQNGCQGATVTVTLTLTGGTSS